MDYSRMTQPAGMRRIWPLCLCLWMAANTAASRPCAPRLLGKDAMVCVCNATYCDTIDSVSLPPVGSFLKYETSQDGLRMELSKRKMQLNRTAFGTRYTFNPFIDFQRIKGFGGSLTDAAAINILRLSPATQKHLLRSYFSEEGSQYNLLRWPLGCSDFSTHPYTYADNFPDDFELKHFNLTVEDTNLRIPVLHRIMALLKRPLSLISSPWTAPAWLKKSNDLFKGALKGKPGDKYYKTWANYFIRFLDEYASRNVTFWAITAQNEPVFAQIAFSSVFPVNIFTAETQRDFIIQDLGPALRASAHRDVLLIIHDDQRPSLLNWANVVIGNSSAAQYVAGLGVHWYLDAIVPAATTLGPTHFLYPNFFLLYTEACNGFQFFEPHVDLGSWKRGVKYSQSILTAVNYFCTGWIDWNLALDMEGGPNWIKNYVDSPIIVNPANDEFYKQPMYYHLAHFSKFIPEGSIHVSLTTDFPVSICMLQTAGFLNPHGDGVAVVLNPCFINVDISISDPKVGFIEDVVRANSIQTYLWKRS